MPPSDFASNCRSDGVPAKLPRSQRRSLSASVNTVWHKRTGAKEVSNRRLYREPGEIDVGEFPCRLKKSLNAPAAAGVPDRVGSEVLSYCAAQLMFAACALLC